MISGDIEIITGEKHRMVCADQQAAQPHERGDADNRKALPPALPVPDLPRFDRNPYLSEVKTLVEYRFADHPGELPACGVAGVPGHRPPEQLTSVAVM